MKKRKLLPLLLLTFLSSCSTTGNGNALLANPDDLNGQQERQDNTGLPDIGGDVDIVTPPVEAEEEDSHARYRIAFVNPDGTILQQSMVKKGELPSYRGATPTLEQTEDYSFSFTGWTPEIVPAYENATYTATYEHIKRFDVRFVDGDEVLDVVTFDKGNIPIIDKSKMKHPSTKKYTYEFSGTKEKLEPVSGDTAYHVTFDEKFRDYSVVFQDRWGFTLSQQTLAYGRYPEIPKDPSSPYGSSFVGFVEQDDDTVGVHEVDGDVVYVPKFVSLVDVTLSFEYPIFVDGFQTTQITFQTPKGEGFTIPEVFGVNDVYSLSDAGEGSLMPGDEIFVDEDTTLFGTSADTLRPQYSFAVDTIDKEAELISIDYTQCGDSSSVTFPNQIYVPSLRRFVPVTAFGDGFKSVVKANDPYSIKSVFVPKNVKNIASNALTNLPLLSDISLPEGIEKIDSNAIRGAFSLDVTFMDEDTSAIDFGEDWHYGPANIETGKTNFTFTKNGLTYRLLTGGKASVIGYQASEGQTTPSVSVPETISVFGETFEVIDIADYVFAGLDISKVTLPESLEEIGEGAFMNCSSLTSIAIPHKVTEIKARTFENCSSLKAASLPEGTTAIGDHAFAGTALTGEYVSTYIDGEPVSLNLFRLPAYLKSIGTHAFYDTNLQNVLISKYVTDFGAEIFSDSLNPSGITVLLEQEKGDIDLSPTWSFGTATKIYGIRETLPPLNDDETTLG